MSEANKRMVVASTLDGVDAATATVGWIPTRWTITLASGQRYRLTANPLTGTLRLSAERARVARLRDLRIRSGGLWTGGSHSRPGPPLGTIETFADVVQGHSLALPIVVAIEMMKAESLIPHVSGGSGG
jgi:hypothetical protein